MIPFKCISTERLILREWTIDDAPMLYHLNADPEVLRYTGDGPFADIDAARTFIVAYDQYKRYGHGRWVVVLKSTQQSIGWCGLRKLDTGLVDLGYRFFKSHWGHGYATEAGRASLDYGFNTLGLPMIIGRVVPDNKASVQILKKLGMTIWKKDTCEDIRDVDYYRLSMG